MQNEQPAFEAQDKFIITGDQIQTIGFIARQQCSSSEYRGESILSILRKVLKHPVPQPMPSAAARRGFGQGDPIQRLDDTPFQQGDPIEKLG